MRQPSSPGLKDCLQAGLIPLSFFHNPKERRDALLHRENLVGGIQADPEKGTMSFGQTGSTRMMCPDMETEQKVLGAMGKVAGYEITKDGKMSLKAGDGKVVMTLEKR